MKSEPHYSYNRERSTISVTKIAGFLLCFAGLGLAAFYLIREYNKQPDRISIPALVDSILHGGKSSGSYYEVGTFLETEARAAYQDGDIYLSIPRLSFKGPVWDGATEDVLIKGVGLLNEATLPATMEVNSNTSIIGNRDSHGMEFYAIDTLVEGDKIYMIYQEQLYTYEVEGVTYVEDTHDWRPLGIKEYPCVTLMSDHPIGGRDMRVFERVYASARLVDITPGTSFPMEETPPSSAAASEQSDSAADAPSFAEDDLFEDDLFTEEPSFGEVEDIAPPEVSASAADDPVGGEEDPAWADEGMGLAVPTAGI